jgi:hypothetical protein
LTALETLKGFENKRIGGEGYGFVLGVYGGLIDYTLRQEFSDLELLDNGLLYLAEPGLEMADSVGEYELLAI